jgi:hypothetical protein
MEVYDEGNVGAWAVGVRVMDAVRLYVDMARSFLTITAEPVQ